MSAGRCPSRSSSAQRSTKTCRRLAVLEDVNGHTNLGAILRSAVALGVDGVLLSPSCADPFCRRSVRVSMGAALTVPCARSADWPGDLKVLQDAGFRVPALTPDPDAVALDEVAYSHRVALMLGAEGSGLTAEALAGSSLAVKIPMMNGIDSLNVAAAAAVAFYAVQRSVAASTLAPCRSTAFLVLEHSHCLRTQPDHPKPALLVSRARPPAGGLACLRCERSRTFWGM